MMVDGDVNLIGSEADRENLEGVSARLADMERRGDLALIEEVVCKPLEGVILSNASSEARESAYLKYRAMKSMLAVMRALAAKHMEDQGDE